jgi:hypothetical protein
MSTTHCLDCILNIIPATTLRIGAQVPVGPFTYLFLFQLVIALLSQDFIEVLPVHKERLPRPRLDTQDAFNGTRSCGTQFKRVMLGHCSCMFWHNERVAIEAIN